MFTAADVVVTSAFTAADNALDARLDIAEAKSSFTDPTTQTLLNAQTARIDTLANDPTTQSLLDVEKARITSHASLHTAHAASFAQIKHHGAPADERQTPRPPQWKW